MMVRPDQSIVTALSGPCEIGPSISRSLYIDSYSSIDCIGSGLDSYKGAHAFMQWADGNAAPVYHFDTSKSIAQLIDDGVFQEVIPVSVAAINGIYGRSARNSMAGTPDSSLKSVKGDGHCPAESPDVGSSYPPTIGSGNDSKGITRESVRGDGSAPADIKVNSFDMNESADISGGDSPEKKVDATRKPRITVVYEDYGDKTSHRPPDFVITRDGIVQVIRNPEHGIKNEIVIQLQRMPGEIGPPTLEQQVVVDGLVHYLAERLKERTSSRTPVELEDSQGLVAPGTRNGANVQSIGSESNLGTPVQDQVQQMNRFNGSGRGTMTPAEAQEIIPQTDAPRLPAESLQLAALKDAIASFYTRSEKEPYTAVQHRRDRGYGVGRYAFTAAGIMNWLLGLTDEDLEEIEMLEATGKDTKSGKAVKIPRGTASKMRASRNAARGKGAIVDPEAREFLEFLKQLNDGKDSPSDSAIREHLSAGLQEVIAGDLLTRFAEEGREGAKVNIGKIALAMHLGEFPSQAELSKPEHVSFMHAAEQAYALSLKSSSSNNDAIEWHESNGRILSDPNDYFFTQFRNPKWNPNGPARSNNCGPASLAMALKALGKAGDGDPQKLIEQSRVIMTGRGGNSLTNNSQILRGARQAGLQGETVSGASSFDTALDAGKMIVALGNPGKSYGNRLTSSQYSKYNGGHYILVVGKEQDQQGRKQYIINDPLSRIGKLSISEREMRAYGQSGVAVWA